MTKLLLSLTFILCFTTDFFSQCNNPPPAQCPCQTDVICGFDALDDYCLNMASFNTPFGAFPGCNGFVLNNPNWFSFVAGQDLLTLTITPSNCQSTGMNQGIQAAIYEASTVVPDANCNSCNPSTLFSSADAIGTQCPCETNPISFVNLATTPGFTYYVVMDGCGGDVCDIDVDIVMGGDPPVVDDPGAVLLPPAGFISDTVCPGAVDYNISLSQVDGAGYYSWLLPNGMYTETFDPVLLYTFPGGAASYGQSFDFCVRAANDCGASTDSTCFSIVVAPLDTIYDPDITLCEGSTTSWRGMTIGPYNGLTMNSVRRVRIMQTDPALFQCEYIATAKVNVINENDENPTMVNRIVCQGQSVTVFGTNYSGNYTNELLQGLTSQGCDTFARLTLVTLNASAVYNTTPPVECSYPGMFRFGPSQLTLMPGGNDPNVQVVFNWYRPGGATPIFTSNNEFFEIDINDFIMEVETFELFITMTYNGQPMPDGCVFGPFSLVVDLKKYIPSAPVISGPDTLCVGSMGVFTATESIPAYANPDAYIWNFSNIPGAAIVNQNQNTATFQFNAVGAGMLCLTVRNTCFEADSCVTVYIIDGPDAGPDAFACSDEYTFNAQSIGGSSTWTVLTKPTGTAVATFDNNSNPMTTVSVSEYGIYQFAWGPNPDCQDDIFITFVDSIRMLGSESYICDNMNVNYTIEFQLQGGLLPYSVVSGNGTISFDMFESAPILSNSGFVVTIEDAAGCQNTFVFNPYECTCDTEGGTMPTALLETCGDTECFISQTNQDTLMDGNDVAEYILHNQPGASISNVLSRNKTGEFCFDSGILTYDVTYYISLVVGDDLGGGFVNLNEGCTRVAPGQPVIWHEIPVAVATDGLSECSDTIQLEATPSVGVGTWSVASGPGVATFENTISPTSIVSVSQCGTYDFLWIEDNNGCRDTAIITVNFLCRPEVANVFTPCNGTQTAINLTITLQNGLGPYTEDNGRGTFSADEFAIDDLPLNMPDTFYFTDANGCQLTVPVDIGDCSCISAPGSMSMIPINDCQDQLLTFTHDATDQVMDANDRLRFFAHTRADTTLGDIVATSDTPEFAFTDGAFVCDSTFYVSAVMGNWTGTMTDLTDPCLKVSVGQPLRFDCEVIVDAMADMTTCDTDLNIVGTSSTGSGIWSAISADATISRVDDLTGNVVITGGPGQYTFEFSSTNGGCSASDQITLTVPDGPTIDNTNVIIMCNNDNDMYTVSFDFMGGTGPYVVMGNLGTITGTNFVSDPIASGSPYSFEILDANDCSRDLIADTHICECISEVGVMTANDASLCEDESFDASVFYDGIEMTDGNDVRNYILSTDQADPTSNIILANTNGIFNYDNIIMTYGTPYFIVVIIGDETSGSNVDLTDRCLVVSGAVSVTWYNRVDLFDIGFTATEITCQDPQISLSVLTAEDITGYNINWTTPDGNIEPGDETSDPARINSQGTYTLTISHPLAGCDESRDIVITQADDVPMVVVLEPLLLTCDRNEVTISGVGSASGPTITYEWNGPGIVGSNTGIDIQANAIGVYTLTVRNTANGCEITGNGMLSEDRENPAVVASANAKIDCDSDRVTVSGFGSLEGNVTYNWTIVSDTGNIVSGADQRDMVANVPGTYELTVLNLDNGCSSSTQAVVEQEGNIINSFDTEVNPSGCAGVDDGSISVVNIVGGVGPFSYSFDGGETFSPNATQGQFGPGVYPIVVRDNNGCELMASATLAAPFDFFVDLGADQIVLLGDEVVLTAITNLPDSLRRSISWSQLYDSLAVDALEQIFTPALGQYSISIAVANDNGCVQEDIVNIFVRFEERVYIPTAMNPKSLANDNRYLNIYADPSSVAAIKSFEVYDRWGERLFQRFDVPVSLDLNTLYAWDGSDEGEGVLPGVYTYVVHLEYVTGVSEVISGGVTILR